MAFDADGYRKAAKAAGISDSEIENEIKFQTSPPAKTDPFEKDEGGFKLGSVEQVSERLGNDWWHLPAAVAAFGAGIYGASKLMGGPNEASGRPTYRFDPTLDVEPLAQQPLEPVKPSLPQQANLTPQDLEARAAQLKGAAAPVGAVPPAPEMPVNTPITAAPVDAPAPTPSAQPNSPVTSIVNDTVKEMIQEAPAQQMEAAKPPAAAPAAVAPPQELRTGTGKPAFAGMGPEAKISKRTGKPQFKSEYASLADVPKGYAVVPNAQYVDVLRGIGQPEFTAAFTGRNFPTDYDQAVEATKEINRQLGRPTRAEAKAAGQPYGENVPGITQRTTENKKLVNVKGVGLGALVAIPDLVKAQTAGERGMAGANLLEAVLPPGFMMGNAGAGSDMPPRMAQAMLLGSPYAQSPLAVKQRQALEYERKVGAGRGIAPPSAYQR